MNKKGFTLIELITTFALATVIIIILLNIISIIKNIYVQNDVKSTLAIEQSNLSKLMNEKFDNKLLYYVACNDGDYCYIFSFENEESVKLVVEKSKISFGEYTYKLDKNTEVKNPTLTREYVDLDDTENTNNFLVINIPIINKLYPKLNFGINLVYFNSDYMYNEKISFKIGDTNYECYEGMTWQDWVGSSFNSDKSFSLEDSGDIKYLKKSEEYVYLYNSDTTTYTNLLSDGLIGHDIVSDSTKYTIGKS